MLVADEVGWGYRGGDSCQFETRSVGGFQYDGLRDFHFNTLPWIMAERRTADRSSNVKRASTFLRIVLWLEGIVLILRTPQVIAGLTQTAGSAGGLLGSYWGDLAGNLESGLPVLGMSCLITVWGMMSGKRWAERSAVFLSVIHLFLFPFFTPVGILGLLTRKRRSPEEKLWAGDVRWQEPVPTAMLPAAFRLLSAIAIVGLGLSIFLLIRMSQTRSELLGPIWVLPLLAGMVYGVLALLHDLGHLAAGAASGFSFDAVPLGAYQRVRTDAGWKFTRAEKGVWRHLRVGSRPFSVDRLDSRLFVHQLGGPMCDLVLGLIAFACLVALRIPYVTEMLGITALLAFGRFLMEMALLRTAGEEFTAGARLLQLWNRDAEGERWCALHSIARSQGEKIAPKEWPEAWVVRLSADPESPLYAAGCFYAYAHYLDRGDIGKAGEFIERLQSVKGWKNEERISVETIFYQVLTDQRSATRVDYGRAGYESSVPGMRAEAMSLYADGFFNESEHKIAEARKIIARRSENGWTMFESTLLGQIESCLQEARERRKSPVELEAAPAGQFAEVLRRTAM